MANASLLTETRLQAALGSRPFRFQFQVESTNDIARAWAHEGAAAGSVVVAEEQRAGRGRFGRAWFAPAGTALLLSVILRPQIAPAHTARLTMLGAVAVAETLATLPTLPLGLISLKWPNDVQLAGRKVAGVLPEAIWEGDVLVAVILGIGLNVSVDFTDTELAGSATNIERVTGTAVDRVELLVKLLTRIDRWARRVNHESLLAAWRGRLATIGQRVVVQVFGGASAPNREISGQALDVDDEGALIVRTDDGDLERIVAGDVTLQTSE